MPGYPAGSYPAGAVPSYPAGAVPSYPAGGVPRYEQDSLKPGQRLYPGQSVYSNNRSLNMTLQPDGNLVIYRTRDQHAVWSSNTQNKPVTECVMQDDGNLVLYDQFKTPHWSSNTHGNQGAEFKLQDDGNGCIYSQGRCIWATQTYGKNY